MQIKLIGSIKLQGYYIFHLKQSLMSYSISLQHGRLQDRYIVVVGQFSSSYKVQLNYLYKLHPVFSELELSGKSLPLPGRLRMGKSPDY